MGQRTRGRDMGAELDNSRNAQSSRTADNESSRALEQRLEKELKDLKIKRNPDGSLSLSFRTDPKDSNFTLESKLGNTYRHGVSIPLKNRNVIALPGSDQDTKLSYNADGSANISIRLSRSIESATIVIDGKRISIPNSVTPVQQSNLGTLSLPSNLAGTESRIPGGLSESQLAQRLKNFSATRDSSGRVTIEFDAPTGASRYRVQREIHKKNSKSTTKGVYDSISRPGTRTSRTENYSTRAVTNAQGRTRISVTLEPSVTIAAVDFGNSTLRFATADIQSGSGTTANGASSSSGRTSSPGSTGAPAPGVTPTPGTGTETTSAQSPELRKLQEQVERIHKHLNESPENLAKRDSPVWQTLRTARESGSLEKLRAAYAAYNKANGSDASLDESIFEKVRATATTDDNLHAVAALYGKDVSSAVAEVTVLLSVKETTQAQLADYLERQTKSGNLPSVQKAWSGAFGTSKHPSLSSAIESHVKANSATPTTETAPQQTPEQLKELEKAVLSLRSGLRTRTHPRTSEKTLSNLGEVLKTLRTARENGTLDELRAAFKASYQPEQSNVGLDVTVLSRVRASTSSQDNYSAIEALYGRGVRNAVGEINSLVNSPATTNAQLAEYIERHEQAGDLSTIQKAWKGAFRSEKYATLSSYVASRKAPTNLPQIAAQLGGLLDEFTTRWDHNKRNQIVDIISTARTQGYLGDLNSAVIEQFGPGKVSYADRGKTLTDDGMTVLGHAKRGKSQTVNREIVAAYYGPEVMERVEDFEYKPWFAWNVADHFREEVVDAANNNALKDLRDAWNLIHNGEHYTQPDFENLVLDKTKPEANHHTAVKQKLEKLKD